MLFAVARSKPSACAACLRRWRVEKRSIVAVEVEPRSRQRRAAERAFVHPLARRDEPAAVADDHFAISEQMMAKRHRLPRLEVGKAGHDRCHMFLGAVEQRHLERVDRADGVVDRGADEQLEIGRDLVVAAARGVETSRGLADQLRQAMLDVHVNVLERGILL